MQLPPAVHWFSFVEFPMPPGFDSKLKSWWNGGGKNVGTLCPIFLYFHADFGKEFGQIVSMSAPSAESWISHSKVSNYSKQKSRIFTAYNLLSNSDHC